MDTKKIKALLKVVECGSLSAAAEELGYTQPGLTNMMNSLESELGLTILIRKKSGIKLSPVGESLIAAAERFAAEADEFEKRVEHLRDRSAASLRIGSYSSIAREWLPTILKEYKDKNPEAEVSATVYSIRDAYEAVRAGALDCAVVSYQHQLIHSMVWTPLQDDELVAIFPKGNAPESGIAYPGAFDGMNFLMPSYGFDIDVMPIIEEMGNPSVDIRYTNMEDTTIASMVAHGLGASIMSRLMLKGVREEVSTALLSPRRYRELGVIVSEGRQNEKGIRNFIKVSRANFGSGSNEEK